MTHRKLLHWLALGLLTVSLVACEISAQTTEPLEVPTSPPVQEPVVDFNQPLVDSNATPDGGIAPIEEPLVTQPATEGTKDPTAEASPAPAGNTQEQTYVVQTGDTLSRLAVVYGVSIEDIVAANNLANPNRLELGQELIIPVSGFAETAAPATATAAASEERTHIVRAGDSLFRIGQLYGFTIEELQEYNNLDNPNRLEIGQLIRIPPSGE